MTPASDMPTSTEPTLELTIDPKNIPSIPYQLVHYLPLKRLFEIQWSHPRDMLPRPSGPVEIIEYLSSGRLWDAYRGRMHCKDSIVSSVIIKVCCPGNMDGFTYVDGYTMYAYDTKRAYEAIAREMNILEGQLKILQGVLIPELLGRWTGKFDGEVYEVVIMEDCGVS